MVACCVLKGSARSPATAGESHGTQHWSLNEWRAALGPLLESHKRKTDPLLSAVAARQVGLFLRVWRVPCLLRLLVPTRKTP